MKKHEKRTLKLENLEERKLTAALTWQLSSLLSAPQSTSELVDQSSTSQSSGLTYGSYESVFKPQMFTNHNETLVCVQ